MAIEDAEFVDYKKLLLGEVILTLLFGREIAKYFKDIELGLDVCASLYRSCVASRAEQDRNNYAEFQRFVNQFDLPRILQDLTNGQLNIQLSKEDLEQLHGRYKKSRGLLVQWANLLVDTSSATTHDLYTDALAAQSDQERGAMLLRYMIDGVESHRSFGEYAWRSEFSGRFFQQYRKPPALAESASQASSAAEIPRP